MNSMDKPRRRAQFVQQVEDLRLHRHVQRGGRLVEDDERRIVDQRGGDERALLHSAAQLMRIGANELTRMRQTYFGQCVDGLVERRPATARDERRAARRPAVRSAAPG
jgi:hypothetical protein